jgi:hypothetical protein
MRLMAGTSRAKAWAPGAGWGPDEGWAAVEAWGVAVAVWDSVKAWERAAAWEPGKAWDKLLKTRRDPRSTRFCDHILGGRYDYESRRERPTRPFGLSNNKWGSFQLGEFHRAARICSRFNCLTWKGSKR